MWYKYHAGFYPAAKLKFSLVDVQTRKKSSHSSLHQLLIQVSKVTNTKEIKGNVKEDLEKEKGCAEKERHPSLHFSSETDVFEHVPVQQAPCICGSRSFKNQHTHYIQI